MRKLYDSAIHERFTSEDIEEIKNVVDRAGKLTDIDTDEFKRLGYTVDVDRNDPPMPPYMITIKKGGSKFVLLNKKYVEDPDFVVGDIAGGVVK